MNTLIKSFVLCALFAVGYSVDFAWQDCGKLVCSFLDFNPISFCLFAIGGTIVHFNKVQVSPIPVVLSETSKMTLTSNVTLSDDLPVNSEFELVLNRSLIVGTQTFPLTIPCVDGMGSCRLKLCDMFHMWYNDVVCPFFKSSGHVCACPVLKGSYVDTNIEVDVPFAKFHGIAAQLADVRDIEIIQLNIISQLIFWNHKKY